MKNKILITFLLSFCIHAYAQSVNTKPDAKTLALGSYYKCIADYSKRLASTKELPADIATASISSCSNKLNDLGKIFMDNGLTWRAWDELLPSFESNANKLSIKTVMDTRYSGATKN